MQAQKNSQFVINRCSLLKPDLRYYVHVYTNDIYFTQAAVIELEQEVAQLKDEKDRLSNLLQAQAKSVDLMKEEITLFQTQAGDLIDGIGEKSTEAENLKSEKERLKVEKDKLNKRCSELMNELEARKIEVRMNY